MNNGAAQGFVIGCVFAARWAELPEPKQPLLVWCEAWMTVAEKTKRWPKFEEVEAEMQRRAS